MEIKKIKVSHLQKHILMVNIKIMLFSYALHYHLRITENNILRQEGGRIRYIDWADLAKQHEVNI